MIMKRCYHCILYNSSKKDVRWEVVVRKTYNRDVYGWTFFYLLPTIEYARNDICRYPDEDQNFDINFKWLLYQISFSRYWKSHT